MSNVSIEPTRSLSTGEAAQYCSAHGVRTSRRKLEALRARPATEPGDCGPEFARDESGRCWYSVADLNRWIAARLSSRQRRAPLAQPQQLARARAANARRERFDAFDGAPPKAA